MKALASAAILALVAGVAPVAVAPCALAQTGERHAGLIIEGPSGTQQFCVAFTAEEERAGIDGIDLLRRAGLSVVLGGTRDLASVCRIGDHGCTDPGDCFCQCRDAAASSCRFWGYYTLDDAGRWSFAQQSASLRTIRDGDVDGWRFANHAGPGSPPAAVDRRCVTAAATGGAAPAAEPKDGFPAGMVAAAVVALAFAAGIFYSARRRPPEDAS